MMATKTQAGLPATMFEIRPGLAIPFLLAVQAQMVLRLAAVYGEPVSARHAKELAANITGGLTVRFLAQEGAKLFPEPGWVVAGLIAGAGTLSIGQVAVQYFDHGKKLSPREFRALYRQRNGGRRWLSASGHADG